MDEDGYVFVIDRRKDLVLVSSFNVFPRKVEEDIHQHPAVEEVAVIGVPDDYTGEEVKDFGKLKEGQALDAAALKDFLADKLGRHKMPKHVKFRDVLPETMIGKLLGHRKVQSTARYAHLARDSVKAAAERVSDSLDADLDTPPHVSAVTYFAPPFRASGTSFGRGLQMIGKLFRHRQVQPTARYGHFARDSAKASAASVAENLENELEGLRMECTLP